jgi:hypothetical protein
MTAISANFPGDAFAFSGSNGLALDLDSLNSFLAFFGDSIDGNTLIELVICSAIDTARNVFPFNSAQTYVFHYRAPI